MSAFSIKRQITYRPHEALERMLNKTTLTTQRVQHGNVIGECLSCPPIYLEMMYLTRVYHY